MAMRKYGPHFARSMNQLVSLSGFGVNWSHTHCSIHTCKLGPFNNGHKIIIVDWKTRNSTSLNYNRKIITGNQADVGSPCSYLAC